MIRLTYHISHVIPHTNFAVVLSWYFTGVVLKLQWETNATGRFHCYAYEVVYLCYVDQHYSVQGSNWAHAHQRGTCVETECFLDLTQSYGFLELLLALAGSHKLLQKAPLCFTIPISAHMGQGNSKESNWAHVQQLIAYSDTECDNTLRFIAPLAIVWNS